MAKINAVAKTMVQVDTSTLDNFVATMFPLANFCCEADSELHSDEARSLGEVDKSDFRENSQSDIAEFLRYVAGCEPTAMYMMRIMVDFLVYVDALPAGEILIRNY